MIDIRKIHSEEMLKDGFDDLPLDEVRDMIGFYEPTTDGRWEVTMIEGGYTANTQFEAEVISSLEEIKALNLKK